MNYFVENVEHFVIINKKITIILKLEYFATKYSSFNNVPLAEQQPQLIDYGIVATKTKGGAKPLQNPKSTCII